MSQSKRASLAEAISNTLVGLVLASVLQMLICRLNHIPMSWTNNVILTGWMTVLSVVRSYVIRRVWNTNWKLYWALIVLLCLERAEKRKQ